MIESDKLKAKQQSAILSTLLGEHQASAAFDFWINPYIKEYITEENKFLLLFIFQHGYASCLKEISHFDFENTDYDTLY